MSRSVTVDHWRENADGSESYVVMEITVYPADRGDYFTPPSPGYIERERLWIDGEEVSLTDHARLADHILATEPIPEPPQREYEHEDNY